MALEALTTFVMSPEFFAGVMTGLAMTKFVKAAYEEVLSRVLGLDSDDNSE